jgi:hypothetical protein
MTQKENAMNTNTHQLRSKKSTAIWWLGGALILATALAITFAIAEAPTKAAAEPPSRPQQVPDAASQGVNSYLRAHAADPLTAKQIAPDVARRAARDQEQVPADRSFHTPQTSDYPGVDRSFHTPQTSNYTLPSWLGQIVPDAATQRILSYLRAHGANVK